MDDSVNYYAYSDSNFQNAWKEKAGTSVVIFLEPSYSVLLVPVPLPLPDSCNDVLPVVDVTCSQCWILVYRPPDTFAYDSPIFFASINEILSAYVHASILGDFNLHID